MYFCVVLSIVCFVSFSIFCVYMCTELLPPGGYPISVKYIISYIISYHISYIIVSELGLRSRYGDKTVGWKSRNSFSSLKVSEGLCKLSNVLFTWDLYSGLKRPAHESDHSIHLVPSFVKWSNTSSPPYAFMTFVTYTGPLKLSLINKSKS